MPFPECPTYLHVSCSPTKRTRLTFPITAVDLLEEQHKDPEIEKKLKRSSKFSRKQNNIRLGKTNCTLRLNCQKDKFNIECT